MQEDLVPQLFRWATQADDPLRSYATGLLAAALEVPDISATYREQNGTLVPIMLRRLQQLKEEADSQIATSMTTTSGLPINFKKIHALADVQSETVVVDGNQPNIENVLQPTTDGETSTAAANSSETTTPESKLNTPPGTNSKSASIRVKRKLSLADGVIDDDLRSPPKRCRVERSQGDLSNSSWAELEPYVIGRHCMFPLSLAMKQRLILQYLTPTGEYQEVRGTLINERLIN